MKQTIKCKDCGKKIIIEGDYSPSGDELCQQCDPGFASLLDNKYHGKGKRFNLLSVVVCITADKDNGLSDKLVTEIVNDMQSRIEGVANNLVDGYNQAQPKLNLGISFR